ncbi:beta-1,3-n-acetylglucosaminyltransferase radical fringe protein, putative (DUF604) [Tasmannia lanceolata]|uniref:beta-1,3-n-acetylglucosaminyltransferase radical fringe protein, putative (DUF604) n=1 Tax=Tasmannia lanceolata TaxID=3420 RepID=UPI004063DF1D
MVTSLSNHDPNPIPIPTTSPIRHLSRTRSRRWRQGRTSTAIIAAISLLISSSAWLSLVFSNTTPLSFYHLKHWDSTPQSSPLPPHPTTPKTASTPPQNSTPHPPNDLSLNHIIFGIAGSAQLWHRRREFIRLWWRPNEMRGHVWLEEQVMVSDPSLPEIRVSEDISRFRYTNPTGHPSGLRISRIVSECFRLRLPGVRWFVLGDDDTIFNVENLIAVLKKYDSSEMVYIGSPSESHSANTYFSHSMAFGGGGIALSYPLAEAVSKIQDECLERYPKLYGSDDRLHACISELGVPLSREYGFHQWDIRGNAHGLLSAHPIAPFVSIHHVEAVDPFYPGLSSLDSLKLFTRAMRAEPRSFLQRSICYDRRRRLTFSVSLGYVVQVFPNIVLPRELDRSEQTYSAWNKLSNRNEFDFDTRDVYRSVCKKTILFFLKDVGKNGNVTVGSYGRAKGRDDLKRKVFCFPRSVPLRDVKDIRVLVNPLSENWHLVPRRLCCKVNQTRGELLELTVGQCQRGAFRSMADYV